MPVILFTLKLPMVTFGMDITLAVLGLMLSTLIGALEMTEDSELGVELNKIKLLLGMIEILPPEDELSVLTILDACRLLTVTFPDMLGPIASADNKALI